MNLTALLSLVATIKADRKLLTLFAPLIVLGLRWLADSIEKDPESMLALIDKLTPTKPADPQ